MKSKRIYLDTNIYLDYCEKRSDRIRPLNEFAYLIFKRSLECEFEIVISNFVLEEINKNLKNKTVFQILFTDLKKKKKLIYTEEKKEEYFKAKKHKNWPDALHAIIAKRTKCDYVITRNINDFLEFSDIINAKLPEEL